MRIDDNARVLQPRTAPIDGIYVPSTPETVHWGHIAGPGAEPVARVAPGTIVTIDTLSHEGLLEDQGRDPLAYFSGFGVPRGLVLDDAIAIAADPLPHDPTTDGPHVVTGPVEVIGATPGDMVTVEVLALEPRVPYGIISNRHGRGVLPELPRADAEGHVPPIVSRFASVLDGRAVVWSPEGGGLAVPLQPFLGLVATAPAGADAHSTPPGPFGGNIDVRLFGVGSKIHLPVAVAGAMVQVGDPHFAQGDGEVALTALEGSLRATLRLGLLRLDEQPAGLSVPSGETDDAWIVLGLNEDLDLAAEDAVRRAVALVSGQTGIDEATAYAWMSAAVDVHISQLVDGVKGAHVVLPKSLLLRVT